MPEVKLGLEAVLTIGGAEITKEKLTRTSRICTKATKYHFNLSGIPQSLQASNENSKGKGQRGRSNFL